MRYNKKILIVSLLVGVGFITIIGIHSNSANRYEKENKATGKEETDIYKAAKISKDILEKTGEYDPLNVDEDAIDVKAGKMADALGKDKEQLKKDITDNSEQTKALYMAAKDYGITVSEAETDEALNELKNILHSSEDGQKQLDAVLAGLGMSEEEYWEASRVQYETNIYINKYLDARCEEILQDKDKEGITADSIDERNELVEKITKEAVKKYIK